MIEDEIKEQIEFSLQNKANPSLIASTLTKNSDNKKLFDSKFIHNRFKNELNIKNRYTIHSAVSGD